MWLIWTALLALAVLVVLGYLEKKYKRCGVYTQPGICYSLKRLLARAHFQFVRLRRSPRVNNYNLYADDYVKQSFVPSPEDEDAESLRPLAEPESHDGITFFGSDCEGRQLLIRLVRRTGRETELLLLLQVNGQLYQLPGMPDTTIYNTGSGWRAGALAIECVLPMRLWRISYRGQLRRCVASQEGPEEAGDAGATYASPSAGELVPMQFSLLWQPLSAPCDLRECETDLMARAVACELWTPEFLSLMGSFSLDGYAQFGCMRGQLTVAGAAPEEVFLRGPRQHRWSDGEGPQAAPRHRSLRLQARMADGSQLLLAADSWRGGISHLVYGVYMGANLHMSPIKSCNISLPDLAEEGDIPSIFNVIFSDGKKEHAIACIATGSPISSFSERPWRWINKLQVADTCLDGVQGTAILEFGYRYSGPCPLRPEISLPLLVGSELSAVEPRRVVSLSDPACRCEALVGGKACSLALLTELDLAEVVVPRGAVVTAEGYRHQLQHQPALRRAAERVVRVSAGLEEGDLSQVCDSTVQEIQNTPVSQQIIDELEALLEEQFGKTWPEMRFAVRSSALGEDGEELSSAGQNATVLGCRGRDQLRAGLAQCWGSLFAPHSVQYRRQHGQHIHPGMAVVVQQMVASEVSGVMFTRDPVTGDPSQISITASYGLGESVVSAKVDPDTITVSRSHTDELAVSGRQLGTKQVQTVMTAAGGTAEVPIDSSAAAAGCLSDSAALRLARIGVQLESAFGGPRDVEWAISKDQIFLLQSRPVTSLAGWSELELTHEHDAALLTDHECITGANTGEVLPNAISPLSMDTIARGMEIVSDTLRAFLMGVENPCPPYAGQYFPITHFRYMIDVTRTFMSSVQSWEEDDVERASAMTIFGHLVDLKEARATAIRRYGVLSRYSSIHQQISAARLAWGCSGLVKRAQEQFGRFRINTDGQRSRTAQQLFRHICGQLPQLKQITEDHMFCTTTGNMLQIALLVTLSENGQNAWDQDMFSSFAVLLSSCSGAESAEVPSSLKRLSRLIAATGDADEFVSASPEEALVWLKTKHTVVAVTFKDFLATHGHRAVAEMDMLSTPWELDPRPLVATLQTMVKNADSLEDSKAEVDVTQALDQLKVTVSSRSRKGLAFLLPYVRQSVVRRECTKSLLVRVHHQFRLAFRRLGQLMVHEGRLPDAELVHFLTLRELQNLLDTRSPAIVIKASRRRRLLPKLNQLKFVEVIRGIPRPLPVQEPVRSADGLVVVRGTPVCQGRVQGTARVARCIADAAQIQRDDILITHATDIGWSPYFPVLGGVVTELGGLISHGAVVAREYGLPCVVGATGATDAFQSGDTVILDGALGTITRIASAKPESEDSGKTKTQADTPRREPEKPTPKPQAETPKPQVETPKAQDKTPKPQAETSKSEAKTPKSEPKTPKPQTETPKSWAETPKPQPATPKLQAETPKPEANTSVSEAKTPKPQTEMPKPQAETPKPQVQTPKSQASTPQLQAGTHKPHVDTPRPQTEASRPQTDTPTPQPRTLKPDVKPEPQSQTSKPQAGVPNSQAEATEDMPKQLRE
ncbi:putative phosphoenolpyruvate synthase [Amphibalanus amphitrite]|uniref:putative phosphoenolpyruvate synthase n=1 Tax=Amphibalanus amphitrite TaxID=1232801 RepID=UPI001C8FE018|nr:putative phosphoenolpyruvate synthase [Amphibalanus amphitrite]